MCAFIVNPPIRDDADYYRHDEAIVEQILDGAQRLVVGLRRSGKTSFLLRVQRAARARGLSCEYKDLQDCEDEDAGALAAEPPDVLLLDEAEVWHDWDRAKLERFMKAVRRSRVVVVTCAPQFVLELHDEPEAVQQLAERLERHVVGALSETEARELLSHAHRPPGPLSERQVQAVLDTGERLAIMLQALGAQYAGSVEAIVSLGGFGKRILTGLTPAARDLMVDAAYGEPVPAGRETDLLVVTGALRFSEERGVFEISSPLLAELVRAASPRDAEGQAAPPARRQPSPVSEPPRMPSPQGAGTGGGVGAGAGAGAGGRPGVAVGTPKRLVADAAPSMPSGGAPSASPAPPVSTGGTARGPAPSSAGPQMGRGLEVAALAQPAVHAASAAAPVWERHARILHMSDLHFGRLAIDSPEVQARRLIDALDRDDRVPDFVVISGDLSWSGHRTELRDAEKFLELIVAWLAPRRGWEDREARRRIIIVPGNHEAAWALSNGIPSTNGAAPTDEDLEHWARYSLGPFANFANRFYRQSMFWDLDMPVVTAAFTDPSVAFVSLSTAHYITQAMRDARFGQEVLQHAVSVLGREEVQLARFRIGVWHHNLRPFQSQAGAITDVDVAVRGFLRAKPALDLALHGHVHQGEVDVYLPRGRNQAVLPYSAVGSFGVAAHHRPGDDLRGRVHNEFALVHLETSGAGRRMQTEFYELKPDPDLVWRWVHAKTEPPHPL